MPDRFKFRHYNHLTKKMTYYDKPGMQVCLNGDFKSGLIFPLSEDIEDNAIYMGNYTYYQQCSGLKDKNGKFIYEGDIVKEYDDIGEFVGIKDVGFMQTVMIGFNLNNAYEYEVIGNIYENPELLEEEKYLYKCTRCGNKQKSNDPHSILKSVMNVDI